MIKKFDRIKLVLHSKDECWSFDLIDCSSLSKNNKNYMYIFTVIDNYTNFACTIPHKDKSGNSTTTAFKKLLETGKRNAQKVWSDRGEEFYSSTFLDFLKQNEIHVYSTYSDLKAVFVARFDITLVYLMKEPMYNEDKACWLNHLDAALEKYNNRVHTTARMTPFEASKDKPLPNVTPSNKK